MGDVDPRFDPQFQRGYEPSEHGRPKPARVEERAEGTRLETPASRPETSVEPAAPDNTGRLEQATEPEPEYELPRRNPFRLILLVVSLAAIAGAAILLWRRIDQDPYGGYGGYGGETADVFAQQFVDSLMVPLLTGGLLGLCLWLALGALRRHDDG